MDSFHHFSSCTERAITEFFMACVYSIQKIAFAVVASDNVDFIAVAVFVGEYMPILTQAYFVAETNFDLYHSAFEDLVVHGEFKLYR